MITEAKIVGRGGSKARPFVMVRVPDLHPHKILTLPGDWLTGAKGSTVMVEVRGEIESGAAGWTALIVEVTPEA